VLKLLKDDVGDTSGEEGALTPGEVPGELVVEFEMVEVPEELSGGEIYDADFATVADPLGGAVPAGGSSGVAPEDRLKGIVEPGVPAGGGGFSSSGMTETFGSDLVRLLDGG